MRWVSPSKTKEFPILGFGERVSPSKTKKVPIDEKDAVKGVLLVFYAAEYFWGGAGQISTGSWSKTAAPLRAKFRGIKQGGYPENPGIPAKIYKI